MNLHERVTALMFAENDRMLSRVIVRFFALCECDTINRDGEVFECEGLPGRKSSSVLSSLSLWWWTDIQVEIPAKHAEMRVATWVSKGGKKKSS